MYTTSPYGIHRNLSAVLAAVIVTVAGLVLNGAHLASGPAGIVEIGQLTPVDALPGTATLAEVVVTAPRYAMVERQSGA